MLKKIALLFIILLGFTLRIHNLSFQPLWGDEGWSFYFASYSATELIALTAADIHPPLYYLLLKGWLMLMGTQAETARLFSAFIGTLLIPIIYRLARHYGSYRLGLIAVTVTTIMPLAIYYSQEVRMYGLVTLLGAISMLTFSQLLAKLESQSLLCPHKASFVTPFSLYILSTTAALYSMYYAVFLLVAQIIVGLYCVKFQKRPHPSPLPKEEGAMLPPDVGGTEGGRFFMSWLAIALLYLPWLIYATPRLLNYIQHKRAVEGYLALTPWHFLSDHLIAFTLGHVIPQSNYLTLLLMMPFGIIMFIGFSQLEMRSLKFQISNFSPLTSHLLLLTSYSLLPLFFGYLINQRFPFTPPTYERTLLIAAPAYWLILSIGLESLWSRWPRLTLIISGMLGLIIALHVQAFYVIPRYTEADYRPMLADIAARATPEDTLLASYQWQYGFYQAYLPAPRPHIFIVPQWGEGWDADATGQRLQMSHDLNTLLAQSPRIWFPAHQTAGHIWEDAAESMLAELGYPTRLIWYNPQTKLTLAAGVQQVTTCCTPNTPEVHFIDALTLRYLDVSPGPYQAGRGIIPLTLTWQKKRNVEQAYQVNLRLADDAGRTWANRDSDPRAGQRPFDSLAIGETLIDRHGLLVEAGTPPGHYRLLLSVRRVGDAQPLDLWNENQQAIGVELLVTTVEVIDPQPLVGAAALPAAIHTQANFGHIAQLVGYTLNQRTIKAGEAMPLHLFWQSLADTSDPLTVELKLNNSSGKEVLTLTQPVIRQNWFQGMLLHDPHDFTLPPNLATGTYQVSLSLRQNDQLLPINGATMFHLTTITTTTRPRLLNAPSPQISLNPVNFNDQAELIGLDLPKQTVRLGETLPITLYWHALKPFDRNWKVFVHLVDESGQVVAQQDQIPGAGQFPTTGWLPPEYLADSYNIPIPPTAKQGQVWLRLGFYDANDFSRLPVVKDGQIVVDNFYMDGWPIMVGE